MSGERTAPGRRAAGMLGLLADEDRMRVVAAVALGAPTAEEIARVSGLDQRSALRALERLARGGVVEVGLDDSGGQQWQVRLSELRDVAGAAAAALAPPPEDHGASDPAEVGVLRAFLVDGRLTAVPAARGKRRIVLNHLARLFEPGVTYDERQVSGVLRAVHPDYAALRRYLVDEGFLTREAGAYWRSGGTVEL